MANITTLTNYAGGQSPVDLAYIAKSPFGATDDRKSTLNDLFAEITKNITDVSLAFGDGVAAAVAAAGRGKLRYNNTSKTFQASVDGGAYASIGSQLTAPPAAGTWTWRNQGGATRDDSSAIFIGAQKTVGVHIVGPTSGGDNLRILEIVAPATPYVITAGLSPFIFNDSHYNAGLCWVDSVGGGIVSADIHSSSEYRVTKWNSATSFNSNYKTAGVIASAGAVSWIRIEDDGVDRKTWLSADGDSWFLFHQVGRTDFITPDRVGWFLNVNNGTNGAINCLVHWVVT